MNKTFFRCRTCCKISELVVVVSCVFDSTSDALIHQKFSSSSSLAAFAPSPRPSKLLAPGGRRALFVVCAAQSYSLPPNLCRPGVCVCVCCLFLKFVRSCSSGGKYIRRRCRVPKCDVIVVEFRCTCAAGRHLRCLLEEVYLWRLSTVHGYPNLLGTRLESSIC